MTESEISTERLPALWFGRSWVPTDLLTRQHVVPKLVLVRVLLGVSGDCTMPFEL